MSAVELLNEEVRKLVAAAEIAERMLRNPTATDYVWKEANDVANKARLFQRLLWDDQAYQRRSEVE